MKTIALTGLIGAGLFGVYKIMNGGLEIGGLEEIGKKHSAELEAAASIAVPQDAGTPKVESITIDPLAHLGPLATSLPGAPGAVAAAASGSEPRPAPVAPDLVTGRAYTLAGLATLLTESPVPAAKDGSEPSVISVLKAGTKVIVIETRGAPSNRAFQVSVDASGDFGWIAGREFAETPPIAVAPPAPPAPESAAPTAAEPEEPAPEVAAPRPRRAFLTITLGDGRTLRAESVNYVGENAKVRIEGGIVLTYPKSWVTVGDPTEAASGPAASSGD